MVLEPKQITSQVYQGGWIFTKDIPELVQLGITHSLNLDHPYPDPLSFIEANITLHIVQLIDCCLMTPQLVQKAIEVIDKSLSSPDHKIYIHCYAGVSRSPTITWLYLIHTGLSPEDATAKVHPDPLIYDAAIVQQVITNRR
ncbi:dual specificity protein phosphatase family protein [Thermodesulfobacteriota bacterium]